MPFQQTSRFPIHHSSAAAPDAPISQFVLKVHGRCDLACDHCYVYEHADQSWRAKPQRMSLETVRATASRIAEHALTRGLRDVAVVLHGGEPLLLGPARLRETLGVLRATIGAVTRLDLRMQSNGVLLTEAACDVLVEFDVSVGISLDGDRAANDRHRRFANGRSSYDQVLRALERLRRPEYRRQYSGILCTVDVRNDPVVVYEALRAQQPPRVDLLLPHATWDNPPHRPADEPAPYGSWLLTIYDRWVADGRPMPIRIFDSIRSVAAGGQSGVEGLGLDPVDVLVVETDGTWEQADSLKTAYAGAPYTGRSVLTDPVDAVAALPEFRRRQQGAAALSEDCRGCPVVRQCGGGLLAHRYRSGSGFDNPSVYCADLIMLITSINDRLAIEHGSDRHRPARCTISDGLVEEIGSGRPGPDAIRSLAGHQFWLAQHVVSDLGRHTPTGPEALELLRGLDRAAPEAVGTVLSHPHLRPWALAERRRPGHASIEWDGDRGSDRAGDRGGSVAAGGPSILGNVAIAAAIRANASLACTVVAQAGAVHLPTVGTMLVPAGVTSALARVGSGHLTVHIGDDVLSIDPLNSGDDVRWRPAQWVPFGDMWLLLEDQHPARDCYGWAVEDHVDADQARAWREALSDAHAVLAAGGPELVTVLGLSLRAVVPLRADHTGRPRSATSHRAIGSSGIAFIADPVLLAELLWYEAQCNILDALVELVDLVRPDSHERIPLGWRPQPPTISAALRDTYARLAVADLRRRARPGGPHPGPDDHPTATLAMLRAAVAALHASPALTSDGRRFVDAIATTLPERFA